MSQDWNDCTGSDSYSTAVLTKIKNKLAALRSLHSGSSAPTSTVAGMLWWDTANNLLKMRDSSDTAWVTLLSSCIPNHEKTVAVHLGAISATGEYYLLVPHGGVTIQNVVLVSSAGVATSDTDYWSFQVANLTQSNDLLSAAQTTETTGGAAIVADTAYDITPDQNADVVVDDVLELQVSKTLSPSALADVIVLIHYIPTGA